MRLLHLVLMLFSASTAFGLQNQSVEELKHLLENSKYPSEQIEFNKEISLKYFEGKMYMDSAFFYNKKAFDLAVAQNDSMNQAKILFGRGLILQTVQDYDKAILAYEQSVVISKKIDAEIGVAFAYNNLALIHRINDNIEKASAYYEKVIAISKKEGNRNLEGHSYLLLASLYLDQDHKDRALQVVNQADSIFNKINLLTPETQFSIAEINMKADNYEIAKKKGTTALELAMEAENYWVTYDSAILLSEISKKEGDAEKTAQYLESALMYKDSINDITYNNKISELELNMEVASQKSEVKRLKQKNNYMTAIYVLLAFVGILLIFLIRRHVKVTKMTREMYNVQQLLIKPELEARTGKRVKSKDIDLMSMDELL